MYRRPPTPTRSDAPLPSPTRFRSSILAAAFEPRIKHRRSRPKHALDGQVRNVFFARPTNQIIRAHVEIPQLMTDIVFEPTQHANPVAETGDTSQRKAQKRCGRVDRAEEQFALGIARCLVTNHTLPPNPFEAPRNRKSA